MVVELVESAPTVVEDEPVAPVAPVGPVVVDVVLVEVVVRASVVVVDDDAVVEVDVVTLVDVVARVEVVECSLVVVVDAPFVDVLAEVEAGAPPPLDGAPEVEVAPSAPRAGTEEVVVELRRRRVVPRPVLTALGLRRLEELECRVVVLGTVVLGTVVLGTVVVERCVGAVVDRRGAVVVVTVAGCRFLAACEGVVVDDVEGREVVGGTEDVDPLDPSRCAGRDVVVELGPLVCGAAVVEL